MSDANAVEQRSATCTGGLSDVLLDAHNKKLYNSISSIGKRSPWNSCSMYVLDYDQLLLENITSMPCSKSYSDSTASIFRSSGYEKSSMVNEMVHRVFTNLRDLQKTKGVGKSWSTDYA